MDVGQQIQRAATAIENVEACNDVPVLVTERRKICDTLARNAAATDRTNTRCRDLCRQNLAEERRQLRRHGSVACTHVKEPQWSCRRHLSVGLGRVCAGGVGAVRAWEVQQQSGAVAIENVHAVH